MRRTITFFHMITSFKLQSFVALFSVVPVMHTVSFWALALMFYGASPDNSDSLVLANANKHVTFEMGNFNTSDIGIIKYNYFCVF